MIIRTTYKNSISFDPQKHGNELLECARAGDLVFAVNKHTDEILAELDPIDVLKGAHHVEMHYGTSYFKVYEW